MKLFFLLLTLLICSCNTSKRSYNQQQPAPKPLFVDPISDGAADPVIIWNKVEKQWLMLYTSRQAYMLDTTGIRWVHGSRIGIAESKDGATWQYCDTAIINYRTGTEYTYWAPEIIEHHGIYHMYLTYVPGIFNDWDHPRSLVHLTSADLYNWTYHSTLPFSSDKVFFASVIQLPDGTWRMWYSNEKDSRSIWYADSKDLYYWQEKGMAMAAVGEGAKVFKWKKTYWMILDVWLGMEVYQSNDLLHWEKQQGRLLETPGIGKDDQAIGGHCDVIVKNDRAYMYYFTHPGRSKDAPAQSLRRSVIQVVELRYKDGLLTCNRDESTRIKL